ncbi:MAG: oxidoreductase [Candidatus Omnitrophica bacterium]|nr:oxidoreductase [Candidatus Omnitrophota bacterium]
MLKDKVIIVAGGAGLLGSEFVKAIAENNGTAIIGDSDEKKGRKTKTDILRNLRNGRVDFIVLDITSLKSIKAMIKKVHLKYGKIDALVNSAFPKNRNYGKYFFDVQYKDFCENLNTHLGGYFLTSQQAALYFKQQGYGNIVNIASIYGVIPPKFEIYQGTKMTMPVEYAMIKSALIHLTKYMAKYLKGMNIRVNAISPGGIFDNQPDLFVKAYNNLCLNKGMLGKKDLNGTLVYLLSEMSKDLNGQNITVDGGFTL